MDKYFICIFWSSRKGIIKAHVQQVLKTDCNSILMVMTVLLIENLILENENGWGKMLLSKFKAL